jgi:hypothetical protein
MKPGSVGVDLRGCVRMCLYMAVAAAAAAGEVGKRPAPAGVAGGARLCVLFVWYLVV